MIPTSCRVVRESPDCTNQESRCGSWRAAPTGAAEQVQPRNFERTKPLARGVTACVVAIAMACSGPAVSPQRAAAAKAKTARGAVRYRLLLRENKVDPSEAVHCYGQCQEQLDPKAYLACLSQCPGFEVTQGAVCDKYEIPPEAACLTARKIPASSEVPPGLVVLAVIGSVMVVVGAASLCASSSSQCGTYGAPAYPAPR